MKPCTAEAPCDLPNIHCQAPDCEYGRARRDKIDAGYPPYTSVELWGASHSIPIAISALREAGWADPATLLYRLLATAGAGLEARAGATAPSEDALLTKLRVVIDGQMDDRHQSYRELVADLRKLARPAVPGDAARVTDEDVAHAVAAMRHEFGTQDMVTEEDAIRVALIADRQRRTQRSGCGAKGGAE